MKSIQIFTVLVLLFNTSYAQFNPEKPNLRQGAFYTPDSANKVLQALALKYNDKTSWEKRAKLIRKGILDGAEIKDLKFKTPVKATIHSKKELDGYTVENVFFESLDGVYVTGNLYRPIGIEGKTAGILCPHGHGNNPRLAAYTQQRCATLARMGAVVFAYDMIGMGDATQCDHKIDKAFKVQLLNSVRALDFLTSLPEVDKERIGMTGESGGGTQTFMLAGLDTRIKVSVPVVMVSAYFFGGCVCESGMPVHVRPTHETSNVEIAALFAPKPMLLISDGDDWTRFNPKVEYPHIQRIYSFYGAANKVESFHLPNEKHDYGISKRMAMYPFLAKYLKLDLNRVMKNGQIDESLNKVLTAEDLKVFNEQFPRPSNAIVGNAAFTNLLK